jgi:hypothetical protein
MRKTELPTRLLPVISAELPKVQTRSGEFDNSAITQCLRAKFRMFEEPANPKGTFRGWSGEDDDTVVLVTEAASKKSDVPCKERYFTRPLKIAKDFLGIIPLRPTYLISNLPTMNSPAP